MNRYWTLLAAGVLAGGCYLDLGDYGGGDDGWAADGTGTPVAFGPDAGATEPLEVRGSTLSGDMGGVRGFTDGIWLEQGQRAERWASVELQAADRSEGWAAMTLVQVRGGVEGLEPGLRRTFRAEDAGDLGEPGAEDPGGEPTLFVDVVGCSGDMPGEWDFDLPAQQVEVRVDEGSDPGWVEVRFEATFQGFDVPETQLVTGSFEVERPEEGTTAP